MPIIQEAQGHLSEFVRAGAVPSATPCLVSFRTFAGAWGWVTLLNEDGHPLRNQRNGKKLPSFRCKQTIQD